jgi:ethanolamine utilization protein EutJ
VNAFTITRDQIELSQYLAQAESVILTPQASAQAPVLSDVAPRTLRVGVDLGTAYLVLVVLDEDHRALAGEYQFAEVARDGLVVDFVGAVDRLRAMKKRLERRLGCELTHGATGYPPGVPLVEVRATGNVLEAAGLTCTQMIDEPTAANSLLRIQDGAIVDVGGGTTGIAVLQGGEVVHTADEATGGTHFSLVIAGALNIPFAEAEALKIDPGEQARLLPVIRPVMEKVGSIIARNLADFPVDNLTLVGGASAYPGFPQVVEEYTGIPTQVPERPVFVTPLGIAFQDIKPA